MKEFKETFADAKKFFKEKKFIIKDDQLKEILACINKKKSILATGPTGCGKTAFFMLLAEFFGGHYEYQSLNGNTTIHDLVQERDFVEKDGKMVMVPKDMILARWLKEAKKGISILQLDEINAARAETIIALHPICDIKGELFLPYSEETLKVNDNAILVMSCNEGDEYAGTNAMNQAFLNRPITIPFSYLKRAPLIQHLSDKFKAVSKEDATAIVNTWEKYMASKDADEPIVSIRVLEYWCDFVDILGIRAAGKLAFAHLVARNEEEVIQVVEGDMFVNLPR